MIRLSILIVLLLSCTDAPNGAIDLSPKKKWVKEGYALNLNTGQHLYKDDFIQLLIETHGDRVAMYCIEHYRYEVISVINKSDTTIYIVR